MHSARRNVVPQRYPADRALKEDLGRWMVARVKPRHEKAVAWRLWTSGVGYYLPLTLHLHPRPDNAKLRKSILPVFPGYISFAGRENKVGIQQTGSVIQFLPIPDQERFVKELTWIQCILQQHSLSEEGDGLSVGCRVRVLRGPFRGVEGTCESMGSKCRLKVGVDMFQRHVAVELKAEDLTPLPGGPETCCDGNRPQIAGVCGQGGCFLSCPGWRTCPIRRQRLRGLSGDIF